MGTRRPAHAAAPFQHRSRRPYLDRPHHRRLQHVPPHPALRARVRRSACLLPLPRQPLHALDDHRPRRLRRAALRRLLPTLDRRHARASPQPLAHRSPARAHVALERPRWSPRHLPPTRPRPHPPCAASRPGSRISSLPPPPAPSTSASRNLHRRLPLRPGPRRLLPCPRQRGAPLHPHGQRLPARLPPHRQPLLPPHPHPQP